MGSRDITPVYRLFSLVTHISVHRYSTSCPMYKLPYLSLSPGRGGEKGGKQNGENHCSATHLGLALVTNVVSVFWGVFFCFSPLSFSQKKSTETWQLLKDALKRFAAQRMKMRSPSAKYAQLDTSYRWFVGISSCVRFKNVHFNHDASPDVFNHSSHLRSAYQGLLKVDTLKWT